MFKLTSNYPTSANEDGCGVTRGWVAYAAWICKGMTVAAWDSITLPRTVCYVKFTHYLLLAFSTFRLRLATD